MTMMAKDPRVTGMREIKDWLLASGFYIASATLVGIVASHWKGHTILIEWTGELLDLTIHEVHGLRHQQVTNQHQLEVSESVSWRYRVREPHACPAAQSLLATWVVEAAAWLK